jgi:pyridoxine 5-phosphate synthase
MTAKLSVNINKLATLRNARGGQQPNLLEAAIRIQEFGADGITVHPRPDERHIRREDVFALKKVVTKEFNIEGYPSEDFLNLVAEVNPEQVTLVPDPPNVLTSDAGWKVEERFGFLQGAITTLKARTDSRVSIFIDPSDYVGKPVDLLKEVGTDRIELYTHAYAKFFGSSEQSAVLGTYSELADRVSNIGVGVNAGHDLNQENLNAFAEAIPALDEVSIGHALVCEAVYEGLKHTVGNYLRCLRVA